MSGRNLYLIVGGIVLALWIISFLVIYDSQPDWPSRGQVGDLFGAVNSLFSGLAFAGLIVTIHIQRGEFEMQREELKLQREELILQRDEMVRTRDEITNQTAVQRLQAQAIIAQVKVAGIQAEIEAIKVDSESRLPGYRSEYSGRISKLSNDITVIAAQLLNSSATTGADDHATRG